MTSYTEEPASYEGFSKLTIYIPVGTTDVYKTAWGDGNNYIEMGSPTATREKQADKYESEVYDLAGRKVGETMEGLRQGVYVRGGKLIMVK